MGKIAAVQMTSIDDVEANLIAIENWVSQAANLGAELIVFPENMAWMGKNEFEKLAIAEIIDHGPIQDKMARLAERHKIWIVGGTLPIKDTTSDEQKVFSSCLVWDKKGKRVARYNKIHLFDVKVTPGLEEYLESKTVFPGDPADIQCIDSPVGKIGLSICYDLRFPELFRQLLNKGAQILLCPAAFTVITGQAHWEILLRARAIENVCYMVAAAELGEHPGGRRTYGHSMIVDPFGKILAEEKEGQGLIMVDIDLDYLQATRARLPVAKHRRIEGARSN